MKQDVCHLNLDSRNISKNVRAKQGIREMSGSKLLLGFGLLAAFLVTAVFLVRNHPVSIKFYQ